MIEKWIEGGYSRQEMADMLGFNIYKLKRILKKLKLKIRKDKFKFKSKCKNCDNIVEYTHYNQKDVYCSRSCSNKRTHSNETKNKIRESINKNIIKIERFCLECEGDITNTRKGSKFCSISCATKNRLKTDKGKEQIKNMVQKSINTQVRRSKNEVLFFEKCQEYFKDVENNKPIFNGWDADVIIHDYRLAVLWNGKWHYEKIREGHSVLQVQNRDRIKIKEIEKYGYQPYIIKDMGRFSTKKVNDEFNSLIEYIKEVVQPGLEPGKPSRYERAALPTELQDQK